MNFRKMKRTILVTVTGIFVVSALSAYTINDDLLLKGKALLGLTAQGVPVNCGLSISGSTLSVTQADGSALSSTGPCAVGIRSSTSGQTTVAKFASPVSVTFGTASDTDGNLFGITDANWSNDMPLFLGVITDGTDEYFTLMRLPWSSTASVSTDICQKGDTDCDDQWETMILTTGLTLSNWVDKPITPIAWIEGTYATSGSAWTFTVSLRAGFNKSWTSGEWIMPAGQYTTPSGKYFFDNGGTAPGPWSTDDEAVYSLGEDGFSTLAHVHNGGDPNGAGSVDLAAVAPYISLRVNTNADWGTGFIGTAGGTVFDTIAVSSNPTLPVITIFYADSSVTVKNVDLDQSGDYIWFSIRYKVF